MCSAPGLPLWLCKTTKPLSWWHLCLHFTGRPLRVSTPQSSFLCDQWSGFSFCTCHRLSTWLIQAIMMKRRSTLCNRLHHRVSACTRFETCHDQLLYTYACHSVLASTISLQFSLSNADDAFIMQGKKLFQLQVFGWGHCATKYDTRHNHVEFPQARNKAFLFSLLSLHSSGASITLCGNSK